MIDICQLSIEISAFLSMHRAIYVGIDVQVIHCEHPAYTHTYTQKSVLYEQF